MVANAPDKEFRTVSIFPNYGNRKAVISWVVAPEIAAGAFYVYRSPDGLGDWELLTEDPVYGNYYEDTDFFIPERSRIPHYRILCEMPDGAAYDSPIRGIFSAMTRQQLGIVNVIQQQELRHARGADGIPILLYPAKLGGVPCPFTDQDTGAHYGAGCAGTEDDCYGTGRVGGYRKPLLIWGTIMQSTDSAGKLANTGEVDPVMRVIKLLTSAIPQRNDLLVIPDTDDRYMISAGTDTKRFRGICPLYTIAKTIELPRNHAAYRLPIPDNVNLPHGDVV